MVWRSLGSSISASFSFRSCITEAKNTTRNHWWQQMLRIERREKEILRRKGNECSSQNSYFRLLNAAVPLSISCCRKESSFNLGSAETKLLYTLHWILLDAADECVLESESAGNKFEMGPFDYLFPLPAITVNKYIHTKYMITIPPNRNISSSHFFPVFRLFVRPDLRPYPWVGFHAKHQAGQREEDLEGVVGVQAPGCRMFRCTGMQSSPFSYTLRWSEPLFAAGY